MPEYIFSDQDIYVNVAGGLKIRDTGVELALALALFSARINRALPANMMSVGELSLAGEIRAVHQLRRRVKTAADSGFDSWIGAVLRDEGGALPGKGRECGLLSDAIAAVTGEQPVQATRPSDQSRPDQSNREKSGTSYT